MATTSDVVSTRPTPIIIAKNGVAKARLAPLGPRKRARKPSKLMRISFIADDFDAPDPEIERLFAGEE
jgi:antitoxin (DNA-binding transcriptional repressor) of toxin-antitoxin stability system